MSTCVSIPRKPKHYQSGITAYYRIHTNKIKQDQDKIQTLRLIFYLTNFFRYTRLKIPALSLVESEFRLLKFHYELSSNAVVTQFYKGNH